MSIEYPNGISVVIETREVVGKDRQNNDVYAWVPHTVVGALFAPKGSIELVGKTGDSVVTTDTLYLPPSTVLGPDDRVIIHGLTYQLDGDVSRWDNPWTFESVLRADLKRVTG